MKISVAIPLKHPSTGQMRKGFNAKRTFFIVFQQKRPVSGGNSGSGRLWLDGVVHLLLSHGDRHGGQSGTKSWWLPSWG